MLAPENQKQQHNNNSRSQQNTVEMPQNIEDDLALLKNRNAPSFFCTFHHKNRLHIFVVPGCCWSSNSNNFRKGGVSIKILIKSHKKGKTFFALLMKRREKSCFNNDVTFPSPVAELII